MLPCSGTTPLHPHIVHVHTVMPCLTITVHTAEPNCDTTSLTHHMHALCDALLTHTSVHTALFRHATLHSRIACIDTVMPCSPIVVHTAPCMHHSNFLVSWPPYGVPCLDALPSRVHSPVQQLCGQLGCTHPAGKCWACSGALTRLANEITSRVHSLGLQMWPVMRALALLVDLACALPHICACCGLHGMAMWPRVCAFHVPCPMSTACETIPKSACPVHLNCPSPSSLPTWP